MRFYVTHEAYCAISLRLLSFSTLRILQFVPKQKKINAFKKDRWARPLSPSLREIIARKNRLWTRYIETRDHTIHKKYKSIRNKVRNETRKLQMEEQRLVASHC